MLFTSVSSTLQVRDSTTTTTLSPLTMQPASLAASWTLPLVSSTSCASWAWPRTARECPTRRSSPDYSAPETEATGVAKIDELWSASKRPKKKKLHSPLTAIHFSSSEDKKSSSWGPWPHFACFCGFCSCNLTNCSRWIKKKQIFC